MPDMKRFRIPEGLRPRARSANAPYASGPPRRRLRRPDLDALRDRQWRPRWLVLPGLAWLRVPEMDVPARLLVPGIAVILLLFGGGLYFGNLLGSNPSAASLITTLTEKGKVTIETVRGKRVKVTLPARTVKKTVRGHRSTFTQTDTQTLFHTHTQIVPVPTTITRTSTVTKTIPTTVTVTVTTTAPTT